MIIKKIKLYNFVSYYEFNEFEFCYGKEKNITLIEAEGGGGKTTLLNALKWGLYGLNGDKNTNTLIIDKDGNVLKNIDLLNKKTNIEYGDSEKRFNVQLIFEKDGKEYNLIRTANFKGQRFINETLIVNENEKKVLDPQGLIDLIAPRSLNFFFEGEGGIEKLSGQNKDTQASIYNVLGLRPIENAITDLKSVIYSLNKEYEEVNRGNTIYIKLGEDKKELINRKDHLVKLTKIKSDEEISLKNIIEKLKLDKDNIPIKAINETSKDHKELSRIQSEISKKKFTLENTKKKYYNILTKDSYRIFSHDILKTAYEVIKVKYDKDEVPGPFRKEFLEGLISSKECLCGTKLIEETNEYNRIIKLIENASTKETRTNFTEIFHLLKNEKKNPIEEEKKIGKYQIEIYELSSNIDELKDEEENLLRKTKDTTLIEEYEKLKKEIEKKEHKLLEIKVAIRTFDSKIKSVDEDIKSLIKKIVEADKKNKGKNVGDQKKLAENLLGILNEHLEKEKEKARYYLERAIRKVYSKVNGKNLEVRIDNKFNYDLYDFDGSIQTGLAGSEAKNKALAFVGGLIMCAKDFNKTEIEDAGIKGGIYPLVLDGPYGELDNEYRVQMTKILPNLSEQVIIMFNSGQWNSEIEKTVQGDIGKKYHLVNIKRNNKEEKYNITTIKEVF